MTILLYKLDRTNLYRFEQWPLTKYSRRGHVLAYSGERNGEPILAIILVDASPHGGIDEIITILTQARRTSFQKFLDFFVDPSGTIEAFVIWPDGFNCIAGRAHIQLLKLAWNAAAFRYALSTSPYIGFDDARVVLAGIVPEEVLKDWRLPPDLRKEASA